MSTIIHFRRAVPAVLFAITAFSIASCEAKPGSVKGTIKVNGKPLASGLIVFLPQTGKNDPINVAIKDGEFDSGPMPSGPAKIYIIPSITGPGAGEGGGNDLVPTKKAGGADPRSVPTKYQDADTSGLTIEVKPGAPTTFDKDLTP